MCRNLILGLCIHSSWLWQGSSKMHAILSLWPQYIYPALLFEQIGEVYLVVYAYWFKAYAFWTAGVWALEALGCVTLISRRISTSGHHKNKLNERSCDDVCVVGFWKESCSIRRVKIVLRDLIGVAFPFRISEFGKWFTYVSLIHVHLNGELTKPHKCCHHHDIKEEVERSGGSLWWLSMTIYSLFHPSVGQ